jgi:hypothetical protein
MDRKGVWRTIQRSYAWKFARQVWKECWSFGRDQIMPVLIAIAGAWAAIHYGIIPVDQTRAAYASFILPFGFGIALYLAFQIVRAPFVLHYEQELEIERLTEELKKAKPTAEGALLGDYLSTIAQRQHADAMKRLATEMQRNRLERSAQNIIDAGKRSVVTNNIRRSISSVQQESFDDSVKRLGLINISILITTTAPDSETEDYWKRIQRLFREGGMRVDEVRDPRSDYDPSGLVLVVQSPAAGDLMGHARLINDLLQSANIPFVLGTDRKERGPNGWCYLHVGKSN